MKTGLVIILLFLISGCSLIPSLKYCDKVDYSRNGTKIVIYAECDTRSGVGP